MQGFNMGRYYPPDASGPPSFNTTSHPLGKRASKIDQGILTVRFELPFAVWCTHCSPHAIVGQGVRFNAEKKKVGNYHSTPIWSFRMKHSACGGWWEIRTDPARTDYTVVEGARRRDYGPDQIGAEGNVNEELKFLTEEEREKRRKDAFASLEGKMEERGLEKKNSKRIEELYESSEVWRNPYDVNARLRQGFREKMKAWKGEEKVRKGMQDKFSLGLEIADEMESDRVKAGMMEFGDDLSKAKYDIVSTWKPLFEYTNVEAEAPFQALTRKLKCDIAAENSRSNLHKTLLTNTKAAIDPFSSSGVMPASKRSFSILKRKRDTRIEVSRKSSERSATSQTVSNDQPMKKPSVVATSALVEYNSD